MKFEIYHEGHAWDGTQGWRWRLKARNGKIIADSGEAYSSEQAVRRAVRKLNCDIVLLGMFIPVKKVDLYTLRELLKVKA